MVTRPSYCYSFRLTYCLRIILKILFLLLPAFVFAQPAYDLKLERPVAIAPYKIWQKDQVYGFGGMANVKNLGTKPPVNQKTKLDIYDGNSTLVWSDSIVNNGINVPMPGKFIPNGSGIYKGVYTVSQDSIDFNNTNNKVEFDFAISDSILAKENVGKLGVPISDLGPSYFWGNIYHITNDKSEKGKPLYCNKVQIGIANPSELDYIFVNLWKWDNINDNEILEFNEIVELSKTLYLFKPEDSNKEIITIPLKDFYSNNEGVQLEANTTYVVQLQYNNPTGTAQCKVLTDKGLDYSLTKLRDSITNESNYGHQMVWDYKIKGFALGTYQNAVPVIRMVITPETIKSYVTGKVFLDFDCDSVFNKKDELIEDQVMVNKLGITETKTNYKGEYSIVLDSNGIYEYSPQLSAGIKSYPGSYIIENDSLGKKFTDIDFALCFTNSFHDLEAILIPYNLPLPGFVNSYNVCIKNRGSYFENAQLIMDFKDPNANSFVNIVGTQEGTIVGNTITWQINKLKYFDEKCYKVIVKLANNTPLGTILTPHLKIVYDSSSIDITPLNNEVEEEQVVIGSYDPNNKKVNKTGFTESDLEEGVNLDYIIRFQNTGNYPATFIEVFDTIQGNLNMDNFEMISASHEYTLTIIDDNILKWRFDNINLPDSSANEVNSHGYIKFRIRTKENLSKQDVISNSAAIYFDFNLPVFTEPAITKYDGLTSSRKVNRGNLDLIVFPNPTNEKATLQFDLPQKMDCKIEIRDISGKLIHASESKGRSQGFNEELLDLSQFANGVYLLRVITNELQGEVKMVKE